MNNRTKLYSDTELNSEVMTASPHRLIQMLLDGAMQQVRLAKQSVSENDLNQKYHHLNRARDICEYLRLCLLSQDDKSIELVELLTKVYTQCEKNLVYAALKNDVSYLDNAYQYLGDIKESWDAIAEKVGEVHG